MANKLLVGMLLCSTMAFSQLVKVDVNLDSIATIINKKDMKIEMLQDFLNNSVMMTDDCTDVNSMLVKQVDSLMWYKKYYMHSKHVIGPRVIGRIEEMVNQ